MASPTVNVVRYTALFAGVIYGFYHRRTLQAKHDQEKVQHAVHERQRLIDQAKEAWRKQKEPKESKDVVTDPDDPRFDLEKLLLTFDTAVSS
ncbi:putative ATP synthase E chain [Lyophyllum shimeji]|uniref:ATP synthase F(0) complex subunit e, mitochondrial n=1 Tax=Lyophyllum shimeji TaxID=47721 RepID=A0A9P3PXR5_LYOSH|nr:putative ATP synthase E chain [Lyophyllum shimeji]